MSSNKYPLVTQAMLLVGLRKAGSSMVECHTIGVLGTEFQGADASSFEETQAMHVDRHLIYYYLRGCEFSTARARSRDVLRDCRGRHTYPCHFKRPRLRPRLHVS